MIDVNKFIDAISGEQKDVAYSIVTGIPKDYTEYKHMVGCYEGLGKALSVLERLMDEEEQAELRQ